MKITTAARSGLSRIFIPTIMGFIGSVIPTFIPGAIAQTQPKIQPQNQPFIEIPKSNFFPELTNQPLPSTPQKNLSDTANDLKTDRDKANPTNSLPETIKFQVANESDSKPKNLSPLQRPMFRLFGFETAYTLKQQEFVFRFSGTSFNNPLDFRGDSNRSNDTNIGFVYGITDNVQISVDAAGKDDTIFSNLVRSSSALQLFYGNIPITVKWKYLEENDLTAAAVFSAELSSPFPGAFTRGGRAIFFSTLVPSPTFNGAQTTNEFEAKDSTPYFSLALPLSYKVNNQLTLNLNPQVSFFPSSIAARTTVGRTSALVNQNVGFDGDRLDYYGTVAGIGIGINYLITPKLQFAADITPVFTGKNSVGVSDNSLFVRRAVWNIGLQYAPNSRLAASIYATNRFGPSASAPSNLLVQPNGEYAIGAQFTFLPDLTGSYEIEKRATYPTASAFFTNLNGLPSAVLPINSILYQLAFGTNGRINPTVRFGILDDLELAVNYSNNNDAGIPIENSITARLALIQDEGIDYSYSSAIGLGIILNGAKNRDLENALSIYADLPTSYRIDNWGVNLMATPKIIIPAEFQGIDNILALTLGARVKVAENTELIGEYTPILFGNNQIQASFSGSGFQSFPLQGKTGIYNIGVRQLIPNGNSVYALDLYFTNSSGDYGLQGISALANGGSQVGIRFNILNGVPESRPVNRVNLPN